MQMFFLGDKYQYLKLDITVYATKPQMLVTIKDVFLTICNSSPMKTLLTVYLSVLKRDDVLLRMAVIVTCLSCKIVTLNLRWTNVVYFILIRKVLQYITNLYNGNMDIALGIFPDSVFRKLQ